MPDVAPPYTHVIFSVYSLKQLKLFCVRVVVVMLTSKRNISTE